MLRALRCVALVWPCFAARRRLPSVCATLAISMAITATSTRFRRRASMNGSVSTSRCARTLHDPRCAAPRHCLTRCVDVSGCVNVRPLAAGVAMIPAVRDNSSQGSCFSENSCFPIPCHRLACRACLERSICAIPRSVASDCGTCWHVCYIGTKPDCLCDRNCADNTSRREIEC